MHLAQQTRQYLDFLRRDPVPTVRTGQTPHQVIHRQGKAALRYFEPQQPRHVPLFVSMPLINTWTVWDLLPGRSVVATLLEAGVPIYMLDWGRPGPEDRDTAMESLVDGLLTRAMDRARRHARRQLGAEQLDAVGYCVGGTFLAIHLALHPEHARRAAFVCTPIDFHASGRLSRWADPSCFPLDEVVSRVGNFQPELMRTSMAFLRPMGQSRKWVSLWERIDTDGFPELWAALEQWASDNVEFPAEVYREYVRRCYFENRLVTGGWRLGNRGVDLGRATIPALAIAASGDHIVEPPSAFALSDVWGGPVETQELRGGHVGICVGKKLPAALLEWVRG